MEELPCLSFDLPLDREERPNLHKDLSKLLNHIKLSEFPYLKWDTFNSVVNFYLHDAYLSFEVYVAISMIKENR